MTPVDIVKSLQHVYDTLWKLGVEKEKFRIKKPFTSFKSFRGSTYEIL